jgi:hypothetical protein
MPEGVIVGGWSFVVAAYAVVVSGLVLYSIYLIIQLRATRRSLARSQTSSGSEPPRTGDSADDRSS